MSEQDGRLEQHIAALAAAQERTQRHIEALAAAQRATEERFGRVEAQIEALAAAQRATEERLGRVEAQIERLAFRMERVEAQIERLVESVLRLGDRVGSLRGLALEQKYRTKAPAYFGRLIRRAHVVPHEELDALTDAAVDQGTLSLEEKQDLILIDLVVQGRRDDADLHLAVEVSGVIAPDDVQRAARRAGLLAKVVGQALPFVAGDGVAPEATDLAKQLHVWQALDGHLLPPAEM